LSEDKVVPLVPRTDGELLGGRPGTVGGGIAHLAAYLDREDEPIRFSGLRGFSRRIGEFIYEPGPSPIVELAASARDGAAIDTFLLVQADGAEIDLSVACRTDDLNVEVEEAWIRAARDATSRLGSRSDSFAWRGLIGGAPSASRRRHSDPVEFDTDRSLSVEPCGSSGARPWTA